MSIELPGAIPGNQNWTALHRILAAICGFVGIGVAALGFIDLYLSITHLLAAWWGHWSWTVIFLGEGAFTGAYAGWMLLDLRDRPPQRTRVFLIGYLSLFVASSFALMLYAGRDAVPDLLSHALIVVAFYGFLIFLKVLVKRLFADPAKRALEQAMADARRYAIDLCKSIKGSLWRWTVPSLLKRQILTGRFPDEVREAVTAVTLAGRSGGWQKNVRDWVLGPDGLNLTTQAKMASKAAAAGITGRGAIQMPAGDAKPAAREDAAASQENAIGGISGGNRFEAGGGQEEDLRALPRDEKARRARQVYRLSLQAGGKGISQRDLGDMFGHSKQWGADRQQEVDVGPRRVEQATAI